MTEVTPPPAAAPAAPSDGKTLGIVGLVLAFLVPLVGLIISGVARSQSKKAGVVNTPATIGFVLGIIFTAFWVIYFIATSLFIFSS